MAWILTSNNFDVLLAYDLSDLKLVDTSGWDEFLKDIADTDYLQAILDYIDDNATEVVESATEPTTTYAGLIWIDTASTAAGSRSIIADADGDTYATVEETADADEFVVYLGTGGKLVFTDAEGLLKVYGSKPGIRFYDTDFAADSHYWDIYSNNSDFQIGFHDGTDYQYRMRIEDNGKLSLTYTSFLVNEYDMGGASGGDSQYVPTQASVYQFVKEYAAYRYRNGASLVGSTAWSPSIDTAYDIAHMFIVLRNIKCSTANCPPVLQIADETGYKTGSYFTAGRAYGGANTVITTAFCPIYSPYWDTAYSGWVVFQLFKNAATQLFVSCTMDCVITNGATTYFGGGGGHITPSGDRIAGVRIRPLTAGSSFTSGVAYIYTASHPD